MIANVLSIAGLDPSGGAGVLADVKTISAFRCYGLAVVTALTAQNTRGVSGVQSVSADFVSAQIDAVFSDIRIDAVKIGMLGEASVADAVAERLEFWKPKAVVLDPVLAASSGDALASPGLINAIRARLLPLATVVTPNLPEADAFLGRETPLSLSEREEAASQFLEWGVGAVLLKGGHAEGPEAIDLLMSEGGRRTFSAPRIAAKNTHGTGCALASAIACGLARGADLASAVTEAKLYVTGAIVSASRLSVGGGHGPVDHFWQNCRS